MAFLPRGSVVCFHPPPSPYCFSLRAPSSWLSLLSSHDVCFAFYPAFASPRLAFARSATPPRPCYRRLGTQFAVGGNLSTGHGRFLPSLRSVKRLPSQTRTRLPIVPTVFGSTPPRLPARFHPVARLQLQSTPSAGTLLLGDSSHRPGLPRSPPRLRSFMVSHCLLD